MSITYRTVTGDTFEIVSRKQYGTENQAQRIKDANPGAKEPLNPGTTLTIPADQTAPQNVLQNTDSSNANEVALLIDNVRFRFWTEIRINRSIDSIDTVEFSGPFDSDQQNFREMFVPFGYKGITVTVGDNPLFTGTMVNVNPIIDNDGKTIAINCYSLPGVLNDCTPIASDKLEFASSVAFKEIVASIIAPFGLSASFTSGGDSVFPAEVACSPTSKVLPFLIKLAKQKNLIISSSEKGELLFQQSIDSGIPVAVFEQGFSPLLSVTPIFSPQEYYSHITGIDPVLIGLNGSQYTVKNERLEGVVRPFNFKAEDTEEASIKEATEAKAARMFANMASYSIKVNTWRDKNGDLWQPNTMVKLTAPDAMIYNAYDFVIRSVEFDRGPDFESATLELIIPGSFSGKLPEKLPWES